MENCNNKPKIMALYLPAFHRIKENDEWWGEGFTEWDNVKKAKKLYPEHNQPQIPLNNNYYDLSLKDDIKMQAELAKKYKVDGFICYHYWFSGKMLLEKPCEIILENKDIDAKIAFCWANEPWARTWDGKNKEILMKQEYGDEKDWLAHIKYLIEFFKDERYIKIENRPLFFVYSPSQIPDFDKMIEFWNNFLEKNGMEKIYLVEYLCTRNPKPISKFSDAVMEFEPMYTNRFQINIFSIIKRIICKKLKILDYANYDTIWKKIINNKKMYGNKKIFKGCFCAWDNSPRKKNAATIFKGATPKKFGNYLEKLIDNNRKNAEDNYIIVNAWNEWGEGAMLEPTEEYKYEYLEEIERVVNKYEKK